MAKDSLGAVVVGTGFGVITHLRALREAGIEVHALVGRNPEKTADRARRTIIAQNQSGQILLIVTARSHFTLPEISQYLLDSDLDLHIALNLDGGTSTGLILTEPRMEVPAFVLMPTVLTVYPR